MVYYKTSFSKQAVFLEKTAKNPFVGGHNRFEGRGASGDKNQCNLFCRHRRFEYFSIDNFFEKTIFSKIKAKNYFFWVGGVTIFEGIWDRTTKMNITLFLRRGVPNTVFKFFSQKTSYRLT